MNKQWTAAFVFLVLFAIGLSACAAAPTPTVAPSVTPDANVTPGATLVPNAAQGAPVVVNGKTLFYIRSRIGSITPQDRAEIVSKRIDAIASNPFRDNFQVTVVDSDAGADVFVDGDLITTISDLDAKAYGEERNVLAQRVAKIIEQELVASRAIVNVEARTRGWILTLVLIVIIIFVLWLINRLYARLRRTVNAAFQKRFDRVAAGETLHYAGQPLRVVALLLLSIARIAVWLLLLLLVIPLLLSFFPGTRELYDAFIDLIREPLISIWEGFVAFLPNLFFIVVIVVIGWLAIRSVRGFFDQVENGNIRFGSFEREWAPLTKNLTTFLLLALTAVVIFPYVPFSDAPAFQGVSIFLGLLFTLSSSSAISNLIAGILLTYNGAFRVNDLVELSGTTGIVEQKRLFTTVVRTFKNEEVSIPNSVVIGASIRNFSLLAKNTGLILHTEITIGYDAPWRQVHQLMIDAALATEGIVSDPAPFVLQRALNDWHVSYEINAFTHEAEKMPRILSGLLGNLQDKFNQAGVEIMSPSFYALRDGNTVTIPPEARPADYVASSFRVTGLDGVMKNKAGNGKE